MLRGLFLLLLLAVIAGVLGFTGMAAEASFIAKFFFFVFAGALVIYFASSIAGRENLTDSK